MVAQCGIWSARHPPGGLVARSHRRKGSGQLVTTASERSCAHTRLDCAPKITPYLHQSSGMRLS